MAPLDGRDSRDDARRRRRVVVDALRRERGELEERGERIRESVDAFARRQLAALAVPRERFRAAAPASGLEAFAEVARERAHVRGVFGEVTRARIEPRLQAFHAVNV